MEDERACHVTAINAQPLLQGAAVRFPAPRGSGHSCGAVNTPQRPVSGPVRATYQAERQEAPTRPPKGVVGRFAEGFGLDPGRSILVRG